jgi:beta-barrel assembly-enhancing protease
MFTLHTRQMLSRYFFILFYFAPLLLGFIFPGMLEASFTIEDEKKLGKEFYDKLQKENLLLQNERANRYLSLLGGRILAHGENALFDFHFSILRSSAINAFATPGGYVYVNQGLINLVENEAELAGVLAHEIAHVNGRHIAEIIDRSTKLNISTLAAILAGAFLGGGGEVTAAVASFSMAAATSLSLKYSREQEEAADRTGLSYLIASGYDGKSMLDFLKIMRRYEYYSNTIPSYFLTHPGTDERSHYIDALIQTKNSRTGSNQVIGNLRRIQVLLLLDSKQPDANLSIFLKEVNGRPEDPDALYGLAVTEDKLGMTREALENFRKALHFAPDDQDILRDLGIALFKLGQFDEAARNLRRATTLEDNDAEANLHLGKTLAALGDLSGALRLYRKLAASRPDDPEIYYNLAMVYGKTGQLGDSHYYFGLFFKKKGKVESALFHLRAAQKNFSPDHPKMVEINKEIDSLKR